VTALAWAARIGLAAVLVVAAVSKLRQRDETRVATVTLLGPRVGPPVAVTLPFVEIALAIALVAWWSWVPGVVAALLLAGFTVVLVRASARHVPCACFGAAADAPPGGLAILRNGALLALAILATATP
jgi:hypothetical protein